MDRGVNLFESKINPQQKLSIMKFILQNARLSFLAFFICFGFTACDEDDDFQVDDDMTEAPMPEPDEDDMVASNTIADFVSGNEDYSSLLAALEATGLTSTFTGEDEYTVFAPDNDAFATF